MHVSHVPQTLSDHSLLHLVLWFGTPLSFGLWRLSPLWLVIPKVQDGVTIDVTNYWTDASQETCPLVAWDAFKAITRGAFVSQGLSEKKKSSAEAQYVADLTETKRAVVASCHCKLKLLHTDLMAKKLQYQAASLLEHSGKNGRSLAYLARVESSRQ